MGGEASKMPCRSRLHPPGICGSKAPCRRPGRCFSWSRRRTRARCVSCSESGGHRFAGKAEARVSCRQRRQAVEDRGWGGSRQAVGATHKDRWYVPFPEFGLAVENLRGVRRDVVANCEQRSSLSKCRIVPPPRVDKYWRYSVCVLHDEGGSSGSARCRRVAAVHL